jgi:uncharacterized protein (DUF2164 family)
VKTIKLNRDTILLISKIDKWLRDEYNNGLNDDVVLKTREFITRVIKRGYYNQNEQDLLNELRSQWIKFQKEKNS